MTALTEMGEGVFVNVREVTPVREKFKRISELVLCNEMEQLHIKKHNTSQQDYLTKSSTMKIPGQARGQTALVTMPSMSKK